MKNEPILIRLNRGYTINISQEGNKINKDIKTLLYKIASTAYSDGYDKGLEGKINNTSQAAYNKGMEDAWECAKLLTLDETDGGLSTSAIENIFKDLDITNSYGTFKYLNPFKVKKVIDGYLDKIDSMEYGIGDIVQITHNNIDDKGVIISKNLIATMNDTPLYNYTVICLSTKIKCDLSPKCFYKTGETVPPALIEALLADSKSEESEDDNYDEEE